MVLEENIQILQSPGINVLCESGFSLLSADHQGVEKRSLRRRAPGAGEAVGGEKSGSL